MMTKVRTRLLALLLSLTIPVQGFASPRVVMGTPSGTDILDLNLPSLGTVANSSLSARDERALGARIMMQVRSDPTFMTDPEVTEYLNRIGYALVSRAKTYTYQFFFFGIRDASLNAFALPGGYIAVHTGTILAARSESELAGVMGHEVGHVIQRHIARMIENQRGNMAVTLGSVLLAILAARAGGNSGGQAAAAIAMGSQAAMIQNQLNYSQDAEREADRIGLQTMYRAGFDPRGMVDFFKRLQSNNRFYESAAPAYLSTHPLTVNRLSDIENRTRLLKAQKHTDSLDFSLIRARVRVLQGVKHDDWLKTRDRMQKELLKANGVDAAVLHYGLSVCYTRLRDPQQALVHARAAMKAGKSAILTKNLDLARFNAAQTPRARRAALSAAKDNLQRFPLSNALAVNYINLLFLDGQDRALIEFLRNTTALSPANPDYHALLARSFERLGHKSEQYQHTGEMYALQGATEAAVYQYNLAQRANDGDFYTMSEIDARLRELKLQEREEKKRREN